MEKPDTADTPDSDADSDSDSDADTANKVKVVTLSSAGTMDNIYVHVHG